MSPSVPSAPPPKRARKSRETYKPPRDRKELMKAIGAGFAVVVLSLGAVLFLGRDHLGSNSTTPVTTVTTIPAGGSTTPTSATPGTTPPLQHLDHPARGTDTLSGVRNAFEAARTFPLDPFQVRALDALDEGRSVLVAAPTGSGKTVVAEYAVALALDEGAKAFYTTPLKALSNQKYGDLSREHGSAKVGLLTGDNAINGDAPAVVMTTEVLRNMVYARSAALDGLRWVVLDEVHYLQNPYRGAVWEEVIIHLPRDVGLVCLSATVSNAEEFADWLRTVRGDTTVVIEERRPVDLTNLYLVGEKGNDTLHLLPTFVADDHGEPRPNPEAARAGVASGLPDAPTTWNGSRPSRCCRRSRSSSAGPDATRRSGSASPRACASPTPQSESRSAESPMPTPILAAINPN